MVFRLCKTKNKTKNGCLKSRRCEIVSLSFDTNKSTVNYLMIFILVVIFSLVFFRWFSCNKFCHFRPPLCVDSFFLRLTDIRTWIYGVVLNFKVQLMSIYPDLSVCFIALCPQTGQGYAGCYVWTFKTWSTHTSIVISYTS